MVLCWAAASRTEALHQLGRADGAGAMDVMLVDLGLPDGSGLEVIAAVRTRHPGAAVMVSTIFGDEQHVLAAIEAGAQDFEPGEEEGTTLFITDPTDLDTVSKALPAQGF
uniref:response regulator n=1 Tax=Streptomyces scabiei TaxID=1930 RepID=UPI0038F741C0